MMSFPQQSISMSDEEFRLLRDFIYGHCGITFEADSKYILEKRLIKRLLELNLKTYQEYYQYLRYNRCKDQELMDIMDILTTNETYFFRESFQLKAFTDEILPELIAEKTARGNHTLRIWSAGCSTGEEPYTIAMLIHSLPQLFGWKIEIIGTDISQRVLQHARRAVYNTSSFRATAEKDKNLFFNPLDGSHKVKDAVREMVTFSHLNLFDTSKLAMLGKVDLIFCRNVIIYFDTPAKRRVIESFNSALYEGGFLLLGHSESLMNISTSFTLRHFKNDMIYQKPLAQYGVRP